MGYQFNSAGGISNSANQIKFKINCREPENNNQLPFLLVCQEQSKYQIPVSFLLVCQKKPEGEFVVIYTLY